MSETQASTEKKSRCYNSPVRKQKAQATKEKVLGAATRQLQEKGFANINFAEVADEAGVALQTVYRICGSKKKMLQMVWAKWDKQLEQAEPNSAESPRKAQTPLRRVDLNLERQVKDERLLDELAMTLHHYLDLVNEHDQSCKLSCNNFITDICQEGLLRNGLDSNTAYEICWAMLSPQLQQRFTNELGWSEQRFVALLYEMVSSAILCPTAVPDMLEKWNHA